jgi:hypothetical protein
MASATQSVTASVANENVAQNATDVLVVDSEKPVEAVAASIVVSRQAVDRSPTADAFINAELLRALDQEQERRFVAQLLAAPPTVVASNTASHRSVAVCTLQAMRAGSDIRHQATRIIGWHPRRFAWLSATRSDTTASTFDTVMAQLEQGGHVQHVFSHALLQTGSLAGQDTVVTMNGGDVRYAEEPPRVFVDNSSQVSPLMVRLTAFRYVAWSPLFASQVAAVSGTGLAAPSSFATIA